MLKTDKWAIWFRETIYDRDGKDKYMERLRIFECPLFGIFIHKILRSDNDEHLHSHPWPFLTLLLKGSYKEYNPGGFNIYKAGNIVFHRAKDYHMLELEKPVTTFVIRGRKCRPWGFLKNGTEIHNEIYLAEKLKKANANTNK